MAIIDRIKWDGNPNILAWKFPSEELSTWSHLIVNETQDAFLVTNGVIEGPFPAGNHELKTENLPILRDILGLVYGGQSPFSSEVWFVNKVVNLNVMWGTPDPIQIIDPSYGIAVSVRAFGQFGIKVIDSKKFLVTLVGTAKIFSTDGVKEFLKGQYISKIKVAIANSIIELKTSVFDITLRINEISESVHQQIHSKLADYGIELVNFNINSINIPPDDAGMTKLKAALAKKAEMNIVGYTFQQERQFDVMEAVAGGQGGGIVSGLGAGLGVGVGAPLGNALSQTFGNLNPESSQSNHNSTSSSDVHDQLDKKLALIKKLAELKDSGLLTEDEFLSEKKKILGG